MFKELEQKRHLGQEEPFDSRPLKGNLRARFGPAHREYNLRSFNPRKEKKVNGEEHPIAKKVREMLLNM